ncbi:30S ribosomal protein S21, chloroplastic-like [Amaranthus tricolor]|uniref:30S ribosomal protein S21, chloroplastic-like n=1 Tax=Amaranthus tricolor TaxID=29722 RepID=UPI0025854EE9|nr:30S ribosomal protein S21, chloroplastic-like [Amaranthus tricolor]
MAISPSSSSNIFSIFSQTQNTKTQFPFLQKTHLSYPLSCPLISLQTSKNPNNQNGLFITSMGTYNVQIIVEENEPEEKLINRFRRQVLRAGVIQECKRRRWFENSQDKRKRKSREAAKRNRRRRPQPKVSKQNNTETPKKEVHDLDDDNWDIPEGNLPY